MDSRAQLLLPLPQQVDQPDGSVEISAAPSIRLTSANPGLQPAAERLERALREAELSPQTATTESGAAERQAGSFALRIDPDTADLPQAYRLTVSQSGVEVTGADEAGLYHGVCTLAQWLHLHRRPSDAGPLTLPALRVIDHPDFEARGVLLDVSRGKVPSMETLYELVDLLADWKINQLQLYTEHTFAYRAHEIVWREASPFTADEIRQLDRYCRRRFIELVPNQNSFGHFHRWLKHAPYKELAECPEGIEHPFSDEPEPFSLCPVDPQSLDLLEDLYDQLLPHFSSRLLNVGLDETLDLGLGRSRDACRDKGKGRVYLEFLQRIHQLLAARGYRMQFWADMVLQSPELLSELPGDAIPLVWGYEADHPFAEQADALAEAGLAFYVCPGTSSWNSLAGRGRNALLNLGRAATVGHDAGAGGYLVTDWGDHGHLQPLPVSYLGFMAGAAFAWNVARARQPLDLDTAGLLSLHAFGGSADIAGAAVELANAYLDLPTPNRNGSALFYLLLFAHQDLEQTRFKGLDAASLERSQTKIAAARQRLSGAASELAVRDLRWVADLLTLACRLGVGRLEMGGDRPVHELPRRTRRQLRKELQPLIAEHRALWLARNRPGGLDESQAHLLRLLDLLA
jgi:hypothetical protein